MQAKLTTAVLLAFVLVGVAACSGGSDTAKITELEEQIAAKDEQIAAEQEARKEAEQEAADEAAAKKKAEQEAADQAAAKKKAEEDAAAAETAKKKAEEEAAAAEAERKRLADAAEKAQKAADTERARVAISGARTIHTDTITDRLTVNPLEYRKPADVTKPVGPFAKTMSSSGRWSITKLSDDREATRHTIEIYSDVEAPTRSAFRESALNTASVGSPPGTTSQVVIDGTNKVVGWVDILNAVAGDSKHSRIAASGSFPRDPGNAEPFKLTDRLYTETGYDAAKAQDSTTAWDTYAFDHPTDDTKDISAGDGVVQPQEEEALAKHLGVSRAKLSQYLAGKGFRDTAVFPERYAYTTSGTLQGASGTYRCDGAAATATCTVQNRGGSFEFGGDWDFIPSSGTVKIVVPDAQYMWFGWWAQQPVEQTVQDVGCPTNNECPTDIWAFQANHGGTTPVTNVAGATGSYTYKGPAAGRYAIYEPDTGDSSIGSFTASATLQASFDTDTVSGTITGFSNDSGWSLSLQESAITNGTAGDATDGVTWRIDGVPDDSGAWEGQFYNNLDAAVTVNYPPHGIAGTFKAAYDPSSTGARAALIGAFGAHR